jgi:hypothetical protein
MKHAILPIYLLVNGIFAYKYGARATPHFLPLTAAYSLFFAILFYALPRIPERLFTGKIYVAMAAAYCVFCAALLHFVPQSSIRLDRHEMISLFWDNASNGINPYTPRTADSNIPSGFPLYFVMALPFYLIGEIGYLSLLGFALFAWLLYRREDIPLRGRTSALALLLASAAFNYEILCRSTIFLNSVLAVAVVAFYERYFSASRPGFAATAVLTGLAVSTRSVIVAMLAPFFIFRLKTDFTLKSTVWFLLVSGAVFLATFVPLLFYSGFTDRYNPFMVQANAFLPMSAILTALALAVAASFFIRTGAQYYGVVCLVLFGLAAFYSAYNVMIWGWTAAVFDSRVDFTYFSFCLPFLSFVTAVLFSRKPEPRIPIGRPAP